MSKNTLKIIPLGGMGEVGRNMMVYEYDNQILLVDTGIMFPENDMLGIDYIIPDFQYVKDRKDQVKGVIVTHGHEDHTGAIHHVMEEINAPVYATPLTRGFMELKLARNGLASKVKLNTVHAGETLQIGPFKVETFHVCHSVPDGIGLGITTPAGLIVHTGDYKFDHTPVDNWPSDYAKLAEFSERGVLALLADSTNAERPGWTPSERVVDAAFDDVFRKAKGRIIIASFASLVSRMQQVAEAAHRHGRKLAFVGTSMLDNFKMATKLEYLNIPPEQLVSIEDTKAMSDHKVAIMCTGSQGEPTSILGRISTGRSNLLEVKPGDTIVLSSHPIPGNEEHVYSTINKLFERGANVIYEGIAPVHVSGHASQEEMKLLLHLTRPKYHLPIHGELRHLKQHALLAEQVGIPAENIMLLENGQEVLFEDGKMKRGKKHSSVNVFVDGSGVADIDEKVMKDRETLAQDGLVIAQLQLNRLNGRLQGSPNLTTLGFLAQSTLDTYREEITRKINGVLHGKVDDKRRAIESSLSDYFYSEFHRRPIVRCIINKS